MAPDALLKELFAAIDLKDGRRFVAFLTRDARFRFGSAPEVVGRDAITEAVGTFFESIQGLKHVLRRTIADGDVLVCEGEVTYTRHDNSAVTIPFANVFGMKDGLIDDYKIYTDLGPLFSE